MRHNIQYVVTIGIPVYRASGYIENTMESALSQTFPDIEYLVIDDCGGDNSIHLVERMQANHPRGKNIRILYNEKNKGVGLTRNRILDEARGQYLYFLDSDDLMEPETIQLLFEKANEYQADVVYGSLDRIDEVNHTSTQSYVLPEKLLLSEDEMATYAFQHYDGFQISACNCLMNLDFLRSHQLRFIDTQFWEDLAFTYEMVTKVRKAVLLSTITYQYLCRSDSLSHYQERERYEKFAIPKNISTINYLKSKCIELKDKDYLPDLCKNLEMNSFYIVCHILRNSHCIFPRFTAQEMQNVLCHPMSFHEIIGFHRLMLTNMLLWLLGRLPVFLFVPSIWMLSKLKKIL